MKLQPLSFLALLVLTACQGTPAAPAASPTTSSASPTTVPGAATTSPGGAAAGTCAAPALLVDASGKATAVGSGGASAAGGTCVPIQEAGATAIEAKSASGKYRLTLQSPKGKPDSADPKGSLVLRLYDAAGKEINSATVNLVLVHAQMGQGHGFDPNGLPAKARAEGGYSIDPVAWPMAGSGS